MEKKYYVECDCESSEHTLRLSFLPEDKGFAPELSIEPHLKPLPFKKRLVNAIRYLFGARSKYGDFEEIFWAGDEKQAILFATILVKYIRAVHVWKEKSDNTAKK